MNNTKTSSVCSILALMALQPFAAAQTAPAKDVVPATPAPAAPAAAEAVTPAKSEAKPAAADAAVEKSGLYSNDKTDLSGGGRPIKEVLKEVADLFGFNVIMPDELDGPVTDNLKQVKWQDFYSYILAKKGYVWRIENEMVVVEKKKINIKDNIKKLESGNISVDFEKVPVVDAVAAICEVMEKNFAPLPADLEGTAPAAPGAAPAPSTGPKLITIKWKGVTWQRTLSEILARYGYGFKEEEGIIRVISLEVLNNVPSETRVYRLTFADAKTVSDTVNGIFKGPTPQTTLLTATFESSQQLVIVTAKPDFLRNKESEILSMIAQIDQPSKQVIIESKIVERSWSNNFDLGFRYAYGKGNTTATGNATTGANNATTGNGNAAAVTTGVLSHTDGSPVPFSMVLSEHDFKFFMDALEQDKTANILQNPSVVVKDDGQGAIRVIRRVPYFEVTSTQGTGATQLTSTTKFINVGTSMYIKPKIKGNGFVELKIDQKEGGGALTGGGSSELQEGNGGLSISAQDGVATAPALSGSIPTSVPVTNNRDVRTTVLLRDGYTVALGGLVKDGDNKQNTQVPILGDIPVLGRLFQSQTTSKDKTNLMAFITARIVDPYNSNYRDMLGLDKVNDLNLSSREIEGGSYKISDSEREALDELLHKRDLDANATKSSALNRELNGSSN